MNLNRMKKSILLLLLVIPTLTKAQNVMTETRRELPQTERIGSPFTSVRSERIMHECIIR